MSERHRSRGPGMWLPPVADDRRRWGRRPGDVAPWLPGPVDPPTESRAERFVRELTEAGLPVTRETVESALAFDVEYARWERLRDAREVATVGAEWRTRAAEIRAALDAVTSGSGNVPASMMEATVAAEERVAADMAAAHARVAAARPGRSRQVQLARAREAEVAARRLVRRAESRAQGAVDAKTHLVRVAGAQTIVLVVLAVVLHPIVLAGLLVVLHRLLQRGAGESAVQRAALDARADAVEDHGLALALLLELQDDAP